MRSSLSPFLFMRAANHRLGTTAQVCVPLPLPLSHVWTLYNFNKCEPYTYLKFVRGLHLWGVAWFNGSGGQAWVIFPWQAKSFPFFFEKFGRESLSVTTLLSNKCINRKILYLMYIMYRFINFQLFLTAGFASKNHLHKGRVCWSQNHGTKIFSVYGNYFNRIWFLRSTMLLFCFAENL